MQSKADAVAIQPPDPLSRDVRYRAHACTPEEIEIACARISQTGGKKKKKKLLHPAGGVAGHPDGWQSHGSCATTMSTAAIAITTAGAHSTEKNDTMALGGEIFSVRSY
jgi:hypothetical protein